MIQLDKNLVASPYDSRDYQFVSSFAPRASTDLRMYNKDIEDQARQGSCVPQSVSNVLELITEREGKWEDLSRQFQYYVTRELSGLLGAQGVYSIRDCLEATRRYGICLESDWPYKPEHGELKPNEAAYESALTRKVVRYEGIDISQSMALGKNKQLGIDNINSALAEGLPVVFAMALGVKFFSISGPLATHSYTPVHYAYFYPNPGNEFAGGHAMVVVGNSDELGGWIVENQWGTAWGDGGYGLIPYSCIRDMSEAWVIREYKDITLTNKLKLELQMKLVRLYVACLGRAPELGGFKYWLNAIETGAVSYSDVATMFLDQQECIDKFGNHGKVVSENIEKLPEFENKVAVAAYFVIDLACSRDDVAKVALDGVTSDVATVDAAKRNIRNLLGNGRL